MHALVPVTHRTTEHAAVKSALMGDGEGREDGTRTSDCRGVGEDAHSVMSSFSVTFNRRIAMRHRQPVVSLVTVTVSGFTGAYSKLLSSGVRHS